MSSRNPLVFLVGAPRSGTTLLQQMLAPEIAIPPETHFVRRFWQRRARIGDPAEASSWNRLVAAIVATPEFGEAGLAAEHLSRAEHTFPGALRAWLDGYADLMDRPMAGEKTPNHLLAIDLLAAWFPDARFLHIVRDPRAVVLSSRATPWTTGTLSGDAEVWRRYLATARTAKTAGTGQYKLVRYEDLVQDPGSQLRDICSFLGIAYSADLLDVHLAPPSFAPDREPWKEGATQPITTQPMLRWKRELTRRQLAVIEGVTRREMVRWGYEPVSNEWASRATRIASAPIRLALSAPHAYRRWLTYR